MTDHDYGQSRTGTPGAAAMSMSEENIRAGPSGDSTNDIPVSSSSASIAGIAGELASSLAAQLAASSQSDASPAPLMSAGGDCKEGQQLERQMLQLQQQIQRQIQEQQLHLTEGRSQQQGFIQLQSLVSNPGGITKSTELQGIRNFRIKCTIPYSSKSVQRVNQ